MKRFTAFESFSKIIITRYCENSLNDKKDITDGKAKVMSFPISAGQFFLLLFSYNAENSKNNQANKPEAQQIYQ